MASELKRQVRAVRAELETRPHGLVLHVRRVLVEALDLAARWDLDPLRVELATWGHDLFRAAKDRDLVRYAGEWGVSVEPEDERAPILLHGPLGAAMLRDRFRVMDEEVLAAVRDHTLGLDRMPMIAKVILVADKVERRKRRRDPAMGPIRRLARRDLDAALLCWADWKWVRERERSWEPSARHWQARVAWVDEHHRDAALPGRAGDNDYEQTLAAHPDADFHTATRDWGDGVDYHKGQRRARKSPPDPESGPE